MPKKSKKSDQERRLEEQRAAAEALQAQIDELVSGKAPPAKPKSLRDFVDQKMGERRKKR